MPQQAAGIHWGRCWGTGGRLPGTREHFPLNSSFKLLAWDSHSSPKSNSPQTTVWADPRLTEPLHSQKGFRVQFKAHFLSLLPVAKLWCLSGVASVLLSTPYTLHCNFFFFLIFVCPASFSRRLLGDRLLLKNDGMMENLKARAAGLHPGHARRAGGK